jgi:hypothetical protein
MATTVKRVTGTKLRLVLRFDNPPTVKQLMDALKTIPSGDKDSLLVNAGKTEESVGGCRNPTKFEFLIESESEADVPQA